MEKDYYQCEQNSDGSYGITEDEEKKKESKLGKALNWMIEHPLLTCVLCATGTSIVSSLTGVTVKAINKKTADVNYNKSQKMVYDRSGGHYWELKRKLTSEEWNRFDYLRKTMSVGDALRQMNVLK